VPTNHRVEGSEPDTSAAETLLTRQACICLSPSTHPAAIDYPDLVTAKDLRRILRSFGCVERRQRGSHLRIECGQCVTTVPVHASEHVGPGLLRRIERDWEPCLGKGWLKKA
jgi:predicted RNA binding protein YcfA (HicA-like mRNA interferase family)